jgi:A/G-specific adenine glycosylase
LKAAKRVRPTRFGHAFVARRADGATLLRRRPPRGLLGGMSEVPGGEWSETGAGEPAPPFAAEWATIPAPVEHGFTHFELRLMVHRALVSHETQPPDGCWWSPRGQLAHEALPNLMRKVIEAAYPGATKPVKDEA